MNADHQPPTASEEAELWFSAFVDALATAAADPDLQCEKMSNHNVAWEIKDDLLRGDNLLGTGLLTGSQEREWTALHDLVQKIPQEILVAARTYDANHKAMTHKSWKTVRLAASHLLLQLGRKPIADD